MINITYNDKDFSLEKLYLQNMKYMLNRLQSMFIYDGLPDTIPEQELEGILFKYGSCFITKVNDDLYAFPYSPVNELDVYDNFTQVNINNVALNLSKVFDVTSGVICDNDYMRLGLFPIMSKYSRLLAENTISIKNVNILLRITSLISASDNKTKASAEMYLDKLQKGDLAIVGESPFFDGIKVNSGVSGMQNYMHQFIELQQYLKGSFFNELGLNANFNMKNERLGANETALNRDFLHPLVDNMKECREKFIEELNKKYNLNIKVEFNSSWKLEELEAENEFDSTLNETTLNAPSTKKKDSISNPQPVADLTSTVSDTQNTLENSVSKTKPVADLTSEGKENEARQELEDLPSEMEDEKENASDVIPDEHKEDEKEEQEEIKEDIEAISDDQQEIKEDLEDIKEELEDLKKEGEENEDKGND